MKVQHIPTPEEIRERRKREYLARWPVERQLEALSEAAMGRPEKLNEMKKDLSEIREVLRFPGKEAG
jgi:hypothetical protein